MYGSSNKEKLKSENYILEFIIIIILFNSKLLSPYLHNHTNEEEYPVQFIKNNNATYLVGQSL